jgi:crossover junction endodeoxyribonuclease RuvC
VRVLGIDPGLTRCGIGVVDGAIGSPLQMVSVGVILTSSQDPTEVRLLQLEREIQLWITEFKPDVIAIERVFSQHNLRTVMGTAQAAGIALLLAARNQVKVVMHTPSEVKAAVTGSGRANKAQVGKMVLNILKLDEAPKPADSADALALAICHIWRGAGNSKIASALLKEQSRIADLKKLKVGKK